MGGPQPLPIRRAALFSQGQDEAVRHVLADVQDQLRIVTPFISVDAIEWLAATRLIAPETEFTLVTSGTPKALCARTCDPRALLKAMDVWPKLRALRLPPLHAKVYVADRSVAFVTSANLTGAGLLRNREYGVLVEDAATAASIVADIDALARAATPLCRGTLEQLDALAGKAARARETASPTEAAVAAVLREVEDAVAQAHATGRSTQAIFGEAILLVLRQHGPMSTATMHPLIQDLLPELCDDSTDRVIGGVHFGKLWKHRVRSAQSSLKQSGVLALKDGVWFVIPPD